MKLLGTSCLLFLDIVRMNIVDHRFPPLFLNLQKSLARFTLKTNRCFLQCDCLTVVFKDTKLFTVNHIFVRIHKPVTTVSPAGFYLLLRHFGHLPTIVIKLAITVFTSLPFQTL